MANAAIYYDANGNVDTIVIADDSHPNYDYSLHDQPGLTRFEIDQSLLAPPINITPQLWEQGLDRVIETIAALEGEKK